MCSCTRVDAAGRRPRRRGGSGRGTRSFASSGSVGQALLVACLCLEIRPSAGSSAASPKTAASAASLRYHQLSGGPAAGAGLDTEIEPAYSSSWDSSPFNLETPTTNNLGVLARACSKRFCRPGVTGLDLWVSIEEGCPVTREPRFTAPELLETGGDQTTAAAASADIIGVGGSGQQWSTLGAGVLCGLVGAASLFAGYTLGADLGLKQRGIDRPPSRSSCLKKTVKGVVG